MDELLCCRLSVICNVVIMHILKRRTYQYVCIQRNKGVDGGRRGRRERGRGRREVGREEGEEDGS